MTLKPWIAPWIASVILVGATLTAWPAQAWAHAVETNFMVNLVTQDLEFVSNYSTGEPFDGATVTIFSPDQPDTPWGESHMDEDGRFSFVPDIAIPGDWRVEFYQDGHSDLMVVPVQPNGAIEYQRISWDEGQDIHHAGLPLAALEALVLGSGLGLLVFRFRKLLRQAFS